MKARRLAVQNFGKRACVAGAGLALLVLTTSPGLAQDAANIRDIRVEARAFTLDARKPERKRFGKLTWLGGLVLRSSDRSFGGYSGLAVSADGARLLALSDRVTWLEMNVVERGGLLAGVKNARIGRLIVRDEWDNPEPARGLEDSEALAPLEPGRIKSEYYIAFEGQHRIHRYRFDEETGFSEPIGGLEMPPSVMRLPDNKAMEAAAVLRAGPNKGAVLAFSERRAHSNGDSLGWMWPDGKVEKLSLKRSKMFDITDIAALRDGGFVVLERHFAGYLSGVFMRIRHIAADAIKPGARLEGEVLYATENGRMVDNMEAIAVHTDERGRRVLTVMSDDNFNPIQRTLLMRFRMP
jgi:hypothetical protein